MLNNVERGALNNAERHYVPLLLPVVFQRSGAVEHEFLARSIRIHHEVTMLEELVVLALSNTLISLARAKGIDAKSTDMLIGTAGRYEWKNKGIDVFLEAMRRLGEEASSCFRHDSIPGA